jgi:hypothetical protein
MPLELVVLFCRMSYMKVAGLVVQEFILVSWFSFLQNSGARILVACTFPAILHA